MNTFLKRIMMVLVIGMLTGTASCSFVAGAQDASKASAAGAGLRLLYVETLRNQDSLRGQGLRDVDQGVSAAAGSLARPNAVYADEYRVYVTDLTQPARIFIFDRGDRTAKILNTPQAPAEGSLLAPAGVAVENGSVIYVADAQQGRVFGYDRNGAVLFVLGRAGELGRPAGLAIDRQRSRLYIADGAAHVIKVFSTFGEQLTNLGDAPAGKLKFPAAVAVDHEGNVYALDNHTRTVVVFGSDGSFLRFFPLTHGTVGSAADPAGIAVDSDGHVYVTDSANNDVLIFDRDGDFLMTWGKTGTVRGDLWTPRGIYIDERDTIYIADQSNSRIQVYQYRQ